jgi:hypothetical protein
MDGRHGAVLKMVAADASKVCAQQITDFLTAKNRSFAQFGKVP